MGKGTSIYSRMRFGSDVMVKRLYKTPASFYIVNLDTRVGTKQAFDAMDSLAEDAKRQGVPTAPHKFNMYCITCTSSS